MNKSKRNTILIVDDEPLIIGALIEILSPKYTLFIAKDGQEAITKAEELMPDVIVLDIVMPGMSGFEVLATLKNSEKTKDIPVIFLTGLDSADAEENGLTLGAADYIQKPFHSAIVKMRVHNQISLIERTRQQAIMTKIAHRFLSDAYAGSLFTNTLRVVGEFMEIAQILLYKFEKDDSTLICQNEWIKPELSVETPSSSILELEEPMLSIINGLHPNNEKGLCLHSNDPFFKEAMKPYRNNYHNFIMVPIFVKGELHALLDYSREDDGQKWSESEINLAILVASIFSGVFERNAIEHDLNIVLKLQAGLVAAKELAEHSNRTKSEFLSRMSHEMRTSMNAIIGLMYAIKNKIQSAPEDIKENFDEIDFASKQLLQLIDDVFDISSTRDEAQTDMDSHALH